MMKNQGFTLVKVLMIVGVLVAFLVVEFVVFKGFQKHILNKPESIQDKYLRKGVGQALTVHPS